MSTLNQTILKDSTKHNLPSAQKSQKACENLPGGSSVSNSSLTPLKKSIQIGSSSPDSKMKYIGNFVFEISKGSKENCSVHSEDDILGTPSTKLSSENKQGTESVLKEEKNIQPESVRKELNFQNSSVKESSRSNRKSNEDANLFNFRKNRPRENDELSFPKFIQQPYAFPIDLLPPPALLQPVSPYLVPPDYYVPYPVFHPHQPIIMGSEYQYYQYGPPPQIILQTRCPDWRGGGQYGKCNNSYEGPSHSCVALKNDASDIPEIVLLKLGLPPKRPLTAFKIFANERRISIRKEDNLGKASLEQIKNEWANTLTQSEKDSYYEKAEDQNRKYAETLKDYNNRRSLLLEEYEKGSLNTIAADGDSSKQNSAKLKFKTAFKLFKLDMIAQVKESNPEAGFRERVKIIKELWRKLSVPEKFLYVKRSRIDKKKAELEQKAATILNIQGLRPTGKPQTKRCKPDNEENKPNEKIQTVNIKPEESDK